MIVCWLSRVIRLTECHVPRKWPVLTGAEQYFGEMLTAVARDQSVQLKVTWCCCRFQNLLLMSFCHITNHLMTGPLGNSEICFPRISMFPSTSSRETLRFSGNKIHCSPQDQLSQAPYILKQNKVSFNLYFAECDKISRRLANKSSHTIFNQCKLPRIKIISHTQVERLTISTSNSQLNGLVPEYFTSKFEMKSNYALKDSISKFVVPSPRANYMKNGFTYNGATLWNSLPLEYASLIQFKRLLYHTF